MVLAGVIDGMPGQLWLYDSLILDDFPSIITEQSISATSEVSMTWSSSFCWNHKSEFCLRFFQTVWWTILLRKIFQAVLFPTQFFQWKLICTFNQHCLSYKISNRLKFNSSLFPHKLLKMLLHWHNFSTCATRWKHV